MSLRDNFPCAAKSDERESGVRPLLPRGIDNLKAAAPCRSPVIRQKRGGGSPLFFERDAVLLAGADAVNVFPVAQHDQQAGKDGRAAASICPLPGRAAHADAGNNVCPFQRRR